MTINKKCDLCKELKSKDEFNRNKSKKDGLNSICRACSNLRSKSYYLLNKQKHIKNVSEYKRKNKAKIIAYAIGADEASVQKVLDMSNGLCQICHKKKPLVVDHDHATGLVRGTLCAYCNKGLGFFFDNIEYLESAKVYLYSEE